MPEGRWGLAVMTSGSFALDTSQREQRKLGCRFSQELAWQPYSWRPIAIYGNNQHVCSVPPSGWRIKAILSNPTERGSLLEAEFGGDVRLLNPQGHLNEVPSRSSDWSLGTGHASQSPINRTLTGFG